jgi:hypothetical protein
LLQPWLPTMLGEVPTRSFQQVNFGRIHGFGTYTWRTNSKYVGYWKEGKMHGKGIKTDPHGNL